MKTIKTGSMVLAAAAMLVGCGGNALTTEKASALSGTWQMAYEGSDPCVGEMALDDDAAGIYWCLTGSEGYVHGDVAARTVGTHASFEIHRAQVEVDVADSVLTGTATVGALVLPFHAHR